MLVLLVYLLFITPVRLTLTWDHGLTVDMRIWGIGRRWSTGSSNGQGLRHQRFVKLHRAVLRCSRIRRFLRRHIQPVHVQALLRIGLNDAASTALLAGLLQQLVRFFPKHTDIRIQPDFLAPTRLQTRCILFFHLGTIFITAAMLLTAYLLEGREHPQPHPKEA